MKTVYVKHPVSPELKKKLRDQGLKIVDARFAPEDAKIIGGDKDPIPSGIKPPPKIDIPENWEGLNQKQRLELASKVSGEKVTKIEDADRLIREAVTNEEDSE
jgi:hypothetical protein